MTSKAKLVSLGLLGVLTLFSCGKEDEDENSPNDETTSSGIRSVAEARTMGDLKLSEAIKIKVPAALSATATSLNLQDNEASFEACRAGNLVADGLKYIDEASATMCALEVDSDVIKFGVKYEVKFPEMSEGSEAPQDETQLQDSNETTQIWVDNSRQESDGVLTVSICVNKKLETVYNIRAADTNGSGISGDMLIKGAFNEPDIGDVTYGIQADFSDTEAGTVVNSKAKFTDPDGSYQELIGAFIAESGVSVIGASKSGTFGAESFSDVAAVKTNSEYGQTVFSYPLLDENGNAAGDIVSKSYFNSEGLVVAADASADFGSGNALDITSSDVPKKLDESFTIGDFPAGSWDCETEQEVTLTLDDAKEAAFNECFAELENSIPEICDPGEYSSSDEEFTIVESEQQVDFKISAE